MSSIRNELAFSHSIYFRHASSCFRSSTFKIQTVTLSFRIFDSPDPVIGTAGLFLSSVRCNTSSSFVALLATVLFGAADTGKELAAKIASASAGTGNDREAWWGCPAVPPPPPKNVSPQKQIID